MGARDLAYLLAAVFPWWRPTVGVGLVEGVGELEVAAPFEVYASSFAARTVPIAAEATVTTRGLRLVATPTDAIAPDLDRLIVPGAHTTDEVDAQLLGWAADRGLKVELPNGGQAAGQFSFDAMLADLAGHSDQTTARVTAKSIEYPTEQRLRWPAPAGGVPTALLALTATAAGIAAARGRQPTEPPMTHPPTPNPLTERSLRAPVLWGVVWGVLQAASPLGLWWLDPATVYALSLALIAAVYIGFAVADGRPRVIAVETAVAAVFVVVAAAGVTGPRGCWWPALPAMWVKDLWQHRPPVRGQHSLVAAVLPGRRLGRPAILVVLITVGVDFYH